MLIDRGLDFGRSAKGTHNTGKQRFDGCGSAFPLER